MSMNDSQVFKTKCGLAYNRLRKTDDTQAYAGDCLSIAVQMWEAEHGRGILVKLGPALTPIARASVDYFADIACPVDNQHSAHSFLSHVNSRLQEYVDPAVQPLRTLLAEIMR